MMISNALINENKAITSAILTLQIVSSIHYVIYGFFRNGGRKLFFKNKGLVLIGKNLVPMQQNGNVQMNRYADGTSHSNYFR